MKPLALNVALGLLTISTASRASTGAGAEGIILFAFFAFGLVVSGVAAAAMEYAKARNRVPIIIDLLLSVMLLAIASTLTLSYTYRGEISNAGELVKALVFGSWPYSALYLFVRYVGYRRRTDSV